MKSLVIIILGIGMIVSNIYAATVVNKSKSAAEIEVDVLYDTSEVTPASDYDIERICKDIEKIAITRKIAKKDTDQIVTEVKKMVETNDISPELVVEMTKESIEKCGNKKNCAERVTVMLRERLHNINNSRIEKRANKELEKSVPAKGTQAQTQEQVQRTQEQTQMRTYEQNQMQQMQNQVQEREQLQQFLQNHGCCKN